MLKFMRNKLIRIDRKDPRSLRVHGLLDDDIYSLELDLVLSIPELKILSIHGKWNRWTTPECPRALSHLRGAVGLHVTEEAFSEKVRKKVGTKACRHYANLLLECCSCAQEAVDLLSQQETREEGHGCGLQSSSEASQKGPVGILTPSMKLPSEGFTSKFEGRPAGGMIVDLHVHSSPASPCSSAPLDQLIGEAKRIGLDGICLTDHHHTWDPKFIEELRQRHGFLLFRGNEVTTDQGDMLVFGLEEPVSRVISLAKLREKVLESGGVLIAAHPFRGFLTFHVGQLGLTTEKAMERPLFKMVDAVEVLNSKVTQEENDFARKVADGLGLPGTGGSDAHEVAEVGLSATQFMDTFKDEKGLIEALKSGRFLPVAFRGERRNRISAPS